MSLLLRPTLALCVLAACALACIGCGGPQAGALSYGESARRDYDRAMDAYADGDCLTAEPLFQNVVREYGYSRFAALAELRVADCELAQLHYSEAIRRYRAFVRARPTHVHIDYANFQIALAYYRQIPGDFFLSPPREERDQTPTRSSLRVVRRFLREYADSEHATEARRIEHECLALLARHELYAAGFYLLRERPTATILRLETLLRDYEGSGLEPDALLLLGRTYLHVRELVAARTAFESLRTRFPESGLVVQAEAFLARMDSGDIGGVPRAPEGGDDDDDDDGSDAAGDAEGDAEGDDEALEPEGGSDDTSSPTTSTTAATSAESASSVGTGTPGTESSPSTAPGTTTRTSETTGLEPEGTYTNAPIPPGE